MRRKMKIYQDSHLLNLLSIHILLIQTCNPSKRLSKLCFLKLIIKILIQVLTRDLVLIKLISLVWKDWMRIRSMRVLFTKAMVLDFLIHILFSTNLTKIIRLLLVWPLLQLVSLVRINNLMNIENYFYRNKGWVISPKVI